MSRFALSLGTLLCALCAAAPVAAAATVTATTTDPADLQNLILEKEHELQQLQQQRDALEAKLSQTGAQKTSLQSELDEINYEIQGLKNSVDESTLTIEKLGLEAVSLKDEMQQTIVDIGNAKDAVARLMVELQQKGGDTLLTVLLGQKTLSEGASTLQAILLLSGKLTEQAQQLAALQRSLTQQERSAAQKKVATEAERGTLLYRQSLVESTKNMKEVLLAETQNTEQVYQSKLEALQQQQDNISGVMTRIEEQLRKTVDASLLPVPRQGLLASPLTDACVTQGYGYTKFAEQAYRTSFHTGLDLRAEIGDPVYAADDGFTAAVGNNDTGTSKWQRYQYGKYIIIQHGNNLSTLYAHLSRQLVGEGDTVKRGDLIGYTGNTGYTFGPHLHFGVYVTPTTGWQKRIDASNAREYGGLVKIPPAAGLVPVGATLDPAKYLYPVPSCYDNNEGI